MFDFWVVTGRICLDEGFHNQLFEKAQQGEEFARNALKPVDVIGDHNQGARERLGGDEAIEVADRSVRSKSFGILPTARQKKPGAFGPPSWQAISSGRRRRLGPILA